MATIRDPARKKASEEAKEVLRQYIEKFNPSVLSLAHMWKLSAAAVYNILDAVEDPTKHFYVSSIRRIMTLKKYLED